MSALSALAYNYIHLSSLCALAAFIQAFLTSLKTILDPAISRSVGIVSEGVSCGRAILFSVVSRGALRCC